MASQHRKLRRLALAGISDSKLVQLLGRLREDPTVLEEQVTRQDIQRSFEDLWQDIKQIEIIGDAAFRWECLSFPKYLAAMVRESAAVRQLMAELWLKRPCTASEPYNLIVYADEVVPGNVLRLDNKRNICCVYAAIKETGPNYLKCEWLWVPIAAIRSSVAKEDVPGGISGCIRTILRRLFLHDRLLEDGVLLDLGVPAGRYARFHFQLGNILADGDAIRAIFSWKGASGKLPCMLCSNVLSERCASDRLVYIDCPHVERFLLASDDEIWAKADRLHADHGTGTKTAFENLQKIYGLTYCPDGVLWDFQLRPYLSPSKVTTYDSMHVLLGNGMAQNETGYLLVALRDLGITWEHMRRYAQGGWNCCSCSGSNGLLKGCWSKAREAAWSSSGVFKCSASEMLLVMPLILHFLHKTLQPINKLPDHIASYEALARIVSLVKAAKDGQLVHHALKHAATQHGLAFAKAYPDLEVKPKNHYVHHLSLQVQRDQLLADAFVGERKNGMIKRAATDLKNTRCFEKSLLMRVAQEQMDAIVGDTFLRNHLVAAESSPEMAQWLSLPEAELAATIVWNGIRLRKGELVFLEEDLIWIEAFASYGSDFYIVGEACTYLATVLVWKCYRQSAMTMAMAVTLEMAMTIHDRTMDVDMAVAMTMVIAMTTEMAMAMKMAMAIERYMETTSETIEWSSRPSSLSLSP